MNDPVTTSDAILPEVPVIPNIVSSCRHEWRVIPDFYNEESRNVRVYIFYCVNCLTSRAMKIEK